MREAGFTLIEILVTLALLSLLAVLLFGGLRFGVRAWDGAQAHGAGMEELHVVQDRLRHEIEAAYPGYDASDPLHPRIDFSGGEAHMDFLAPAPQALDTPGRIRTVLSVARDGNDARLDMEAGDAASALLRHAASIRFAYSDGDRWTDSWNGTLPKLIRIRVSFKPRDGRIWPDLIVAPHIDADSGCVYDPSIRHCAGRP
ncbi:MAG TPA: prepilin-type N-terminal cleavage/methylation domain-containing protein [Rhizomicrobium sp.]|jgi:general secretion pathway protein J|nr:prepilin-type N-terminal cleavage/methylation domain-containing protein [Rhizomicrobium sp.]